MDNKTAAKQGKTEDTTKKSLETGSKAIAVDKDLKKQQGDDKTEEKEQKDAEKWRNEG